MPSHHIIRSKITIPFTDSALFTRPELITSLQMATYHRLTTVTAPAGFSKTTVVSQALLSQGVAWLSLDPADNRSQRFWIHFIFALRTIHPQFGEQTLVQLDQYALPDPEFFLGSLLQDLQTFNAPLVLVLDDFHVLDNPEILTGINDLLKLPQIPLHWVVLSRTLCAHLPISRLKGRNQLCEFTAEHLRLSNQEMQRFFEEKELPLDAQALSQIANFSEGWMLALQMILYSLPRAPQPTSWSKALAESQYHLQKYLMDEVFNTLPSPVQRFLVLSSVLETMEPQLTRYVLQGQETCDLETIQSLDLFLQSIDPQKQEWRYHHLFREFLQQRLHAEYPLTTQYHLLRRASTWYAQQQNRERAIDYALLAQDNTQAITHLLAIGFTMLAEGGSAMGRLTHWLEKIPQHDDKYHIKLHILRLFVWVSTQKLESATPLVWQLPETEDVLPYKLVLCMDVVRRQKHNFHSIFEYGDRLCQIPIPSHSDFLLSVAHSYLANCHASLGRSEEALVHTEKAIHHSLVSRNKSAYFFNQLQKGSMYIQKGHFDQAEKAYKSLLSTTASEQWQHSPIHGRAFIGLALIAAYASQKSLAENLARQGFDLTVKSENTYKTLGFQLVFEICCMTRGWQLMDELLLHYDKIKWEHHLSDAALSLPLYQAWRAIQSHDFTLAQAWCESPVKEPQDLREWFIRSLYHVKQSHYVKAAPFLSGAHALAEKSQNMPCLIQVLCLQAITLKSTPSKALEKIQEAFYLTGNENFNFVWQEFDALLPLIQQHTWDTEAQKKWKSIYPQLQWQESLTEREYELLKLLALGLSNREIAKHISVSENTVKTHLKNLFQKLQVNRRTQAIAIAKAQHLI